MSKAAVDSVESSVISCSYLFGAQEWLLKVHGPQISLLYFYTMEWHLVPLFHGK